MISYINRTPAPDGVHLHAYGAADDYVVPATRAGLRGQPVRMEDPRGAADDHSGILRDPNTIRDVQRDLMGQRKPFRGLLREARYVVEPSGIAVGEDVVANGLLIAGPQ